MACGLLKDLEENKHKVGLAPAPRPMFEGHKIHVVVSSNPEWYSELYEEQGYVRRKTVVSALVRISKRIVRNYKYDKMMLEVIDGMIKYYRSFYV